MNLGIFQKELQEMCATRGLKGEFLDNGKDLIYCMGLEAVPENPYKVIESTSNKSLFYPKEFAIIIDPENDVEAMRQFLDWAGKAELIKTLYEARNLEIPDRLRREEVEKLQIYNDGHFNPNHDVQFQTHNALLVEEFFKKEKHQGFISRAWREYTRSPRYDKGASFLSRFINFFRRGRQNVPFKILKEHSNTIRKVTIKESDWKYVKKCLKAKYPDMVYYAAPVKKDIYKVKRDINTGDKSSTFEKGTYDYSTRDIFICKEDESKFANVYNPITYSDITKDWVEMEERLRGVKLNYFKMPQEYAYDFLKTLNRYSIPYLLDDGKYTQTSLDSINVVYPTGCNDHVQAYARAVVESFGRNYPISEEQKNSLLKNINFLLHPRQKTFLHPG